MPTDPKDLAKRTGGRPRGPTRNDVYIRGPLVSTKLNHANFLVAIEQLCGKDGTKLAKIAWDIARGKSFRPKFRDLNGVVKFGPEQVPSARIRLDAVKLLLDYWAGKPQEADDSDPEQMNNEQLFKTANEVLAKIRADEERAGNKASTKEVVGEVVQKPEPEVTEEPEPEEPEDET